MTEKDQTSGTIEEEMQTKITTQGDEIKKQINIYQE
jgi:hypothetical protein